MANLNDSVVPGDKQFMNKNFKGLFSKGYPTDILGFKLFQNKVNLGSNVVEIGEGKNFSGVADQIGMKGKKGNSGIISIASK